MSKKKRMFLIIFMVIYVVSKVYVSYTANPYDDAIPDRIKDIVLRLAMLNPETEG